MRRENQLKSTRIRAWRGFSRFYNSFAARAVFAALFLCSACATQTAPDGKVSSSFNLRHLAQTDIDRVVEVNRSEVIASLRRLAEKLYRRNPREWQKAGLVNRDAALNRLFVPGASTDKIDGHSEGSAVLLSLSANYEGDRVHAFITGLLGMVNAAFENKAEFYILDSLNEQKLYNCARNVEIAVWKISTAKSDSGEPLLYSNALDSNHPNLSFEREFGRIIALLDFLSIVVADKQGRSILRVSQSLATAIFLPISALGF